MPSPNIITRLLALLGPKSHQQIDRSEIRERHRARCNDFRLLIRANNRALEAMSSVEEALRGTIPFSMSYIKSTCVNIASAVHQMVQRINALSENNYSDLEERFTQINLEIGKILAPGRHRQDGALVLPLRAICREHAQEVGPKALNISLAATDLGITIPEGFVITANAYRLFMEYAGLQDEIHRLTQIADTNDLEGLAQLSHALQEKIENAQLPSRLEDAIQDACQVLRVHSGSKRPLAVRSSALGEDLPGASAAGQYRTLLNVHINDVVSAYKKVVAGKYDVPAIAYRFNRGLKDEDIIAASGMWMGVLLLLTSYFDIAKYLQKIVPREVIRGVQVSTGMLLALQGVRFIAGISPLQADFSEPWLKLNSLGSLPWSLILGMTSLFALLSLLDNRRLPGSLVVVIGGIYSGYLPGQRP